MISFLVVALFAAAQKNSVPASRPQVLLDADKMAGAFLKKDYNTFVKYTYPGLIEKAGGRESFLMKFESSIKELESEGAKCDSVIISEPSQMVTCYGMLQCVLKQEMVVSYTGQKSYKDITYLIAFSGDDGKSWTFLNGARRTLLEIVKEFPRVCGNLPLDEKYIH